MASNSNVRRSQEDYITQVSEEIEGRVTKKLSQEFSRTEYRILGALARLDDFLMNPVLQGHFGTTPETSRNMFSIDQGTNEDDSQSNPHPEAGLLTSGREDRHGMATGAQKESAVGQDTRNIQFGIITTECIAPKCVHLYLGQGKLDEPTELAYTLRLQKSQEWTENYRHLTSLLAASWQMPPKSTSKRFSKLL